MKKILSLKDEFHAQLLKYFVFRVYRVAGVTRIGGAPIMDAGSGFFIRLSKNRLYFLMTCHQYKGLKGTVATILPHNKSKLIDEKININYIRLFDAQHGRDQPEHILLEKLDVATIPFLNSNEENIEDIRVFDSELLWGALTEPESLKKKFGNLLFGGFASKDNGGQLYGRNHMGYTTTFYESIDWKIDGDTIIIQMEEYLGRGQVFNTAMQGMSGSPILIFNINRRADVGITANISASVIGIVTHIETSSGIVYGTNLLNVFRGVRIKDDVTDSVLDLFKAQQNCN